METRIVCAAKRIEGSPPDYRDTVHSVHARYYGDACVRHHSGCANFTAFLFVLYGAQEENEGNKSLAKVAREKAEEWKSRFEAERALRRALNAKVLDMQVRRNQKALPDSIMPNPSPLGFLYRLIFLNASAEISTG